VVKAEGGASFISTMKTLKVGCTNSMGISEDPLMVHYKHLDVGDNTDPNNLVTGNALDVMTIIPPIADRTYCIPT
jgi:hypothetical protein